MGAAALFVLGFAAISRATEPRSAAQNSALVSPADTDAGIGWNDDRARLLFAGALVRLPWANRCVKLRFRPPKGAACVPLLGVLFGLGWTPCIGPTLAAVLTLATTTGGACVARPLHSCTASAWAARPARRRIGGSGHGRLRVAAQTRRAIMRLGGLMLVAVGSLQVTGAWPALTARMQGLISGFQLPL